MKRSPQVFRFLAALVCVCVLFSSFGGLTTAKAYAPNGNATIFNVKQDSGNNGPDGKPMGSRPVDQVTLLAGNSEALRGGKGDITLGELIENYWDQYLLGVAADFCVFLDGDFEVRDSDAEGRVAVAGDFIINENYGSYSVGAGDYTHATALDDLLPDRIGAATVVLGGKLTRTLSDGKGSVISDVYYDNGIKYENTGDGPGYQNASHKSTKKLVLNYDGISLPSWADDSSQFWNTIPKESPENNDWSSPWAKIDRTQTYITQLIDFSSVYTRLNARARLLKAQEELTQRPDNTEITYDGSTLTLKYTGPETVQDCVFFTLDAENFAYFQKADIISYEGIPKLPEACSVIDNYGNETTWPYAYIIVNVDFAGISAAQAMAGYGADLKDSADATAHRSYKLDDDKKYIFLGNSSSHNAKTRINGTKISVAEGVDNNDIGVASLLYNFYQTDENSVIVIANNFQGTIFAPNAHVTDEATCKLEAGMNPGQYDRGHISGALVASSFKGYTEFGYRPFSASFTQILGSGNLAITKTVEGDGADADQTFTFTVKLSAEDDFDELLTGTRVYPVTVSLASDATDKAIPDTYTSVTFTNGEATITIKAGQKVTIRDLPAGYTYTITETDLPLGYVSGVISGTDEGTIVAGSTQTAGFRNTYHTGSLTVEKTLVGDIPDPAPVFTFTVTLIDPETNRTATGISGTYGEMNFNSGVATVLVTAGTRKTATGLPAGLNYTVSEANLDGYELNSSDGVAGAIPADDNVTASFVNAKIGEKTGSLTVSKQVTGAGETTDTFTFTVTVTKDGEGINGTYDGVDFVNGVATVTVAAGESKTISGLPADATYTVVEQAKEGYEQVSATGATGTIPADGNEEAAFINAKKEDSEEEDKFGSLTVSKQVTGASETADTFTFTVTVTKDGEGINGAYDGVDFVNGVATVTVVAGESKTISGLPADATYTVVEQAKEGYEQVSATGAEGTIPADGNAEATFINAKKEDSEEEEDKFGSLTVSKQVTGASETADTFTFTVTVMKDGEGINGIYDGVNFVNGVATITVKAGESKTISGLPADATYTVVEQAKEGYEQVGATGATGTIPADGMAQASFINAMDSIEDDDGNEEEATGDLIVTKQVSGNAGDKTKAFTFTVLLSDTGINGVYGDMTFSGGVATFTLKHGESKTASGLPEGLRYSVSEAAANQDGYTTTSVGDRGTIPASDTVTAIFINAKDDAASDMPQTGDNSRLGLWVALMLAAMALMVACVLVGRKQGHNRR